MPEVLGVEEDAIADLVFGLRKSFLIRYRPP